MSLHHQHARLLARIAEIRESAYRCADREPQRAELLRDQAAEMLRDAAALRDVIEDMPGTIADPAQLPLPMETRA
jgi:hypothetical protein